MRKKKNNVIIEEKIIEKFEITENKPSIIVRIFMPFVYGFAVALVVFLSGSKLLNLVIKGEVSKQSPVVEVKKLPKGEVKKALEIAVGIQLGPMELVKLIDSNNTSLVILDTRSKQEYDNGHIKGAVMKLGETKKKTVVVYGQTSFDEVPKRVAIGLLEKGIDAKILSIGWNEFRHFRNLWVPDSLWGKFLPEKYLSD